MAAFNPLVYRMYRIPFWKRNKERNIIKQIEIYNGYKIQTINQLENTIMIIIILKINCVGLILDVRIFLFVATNWRITEIECKVSFVVNTALENFSVSKFRKFNWMFSFGIKTNTSYYVSNNYNHNHHIHIQTDRGFVRVEGQAHRPLMCCAPSFNVKLLLQGPLDILDFKSVVCYRTWTYTHISLHTN